MTPFFYIIFQLKIFMIIIKDKENTSLIHLSNSTNVDDYIVQDLYALTIDELYRLLEELDAKIDTPSEPSEPDEPTGDVKLQNIKYAIIKKIMSTIAPDKGFDGMKSVEIDATPLYNQGVEKGYQNGKQDGIDEGYATGKQDGIEEQKSKLSSISITENGTYVNKDGYNKVVVDIETNPIAIQDYKSVEISEISETITPDDGFDGMKSVSVNANQVYENGRIDGIEEQKNKLTSIEIKKNGLYANTDGYNEIFVNTSFYRLYDGKIEGLYRLGWNEEDIKYYNDNHLHFSSEDYLYEVTDGNNDIIIHSIEDIQNYANNPDFVYLPKENIEKWLLADDKHWAIGMFKDCKYLKGIPKLPLKYYYFYADDMFNGCSQLEVMPYPYMPMSANYMFNNCKNLKLIGLDFLLSEEMNGTFAGCTSLVSLRNLNTNLVRTMNGTFVGCISLKTLPVLGETQYLTSVDSMFDYCISLMSLPLIDFQSVENISNFFGATELGKLTDLGGFKDLKVDWNDGYGLNKCPNLTKQSVLNVINNLYDFRANGDTTTTRTIKFNSKSLALLSDEEKQIATSKGWVLTN